MTFGLIFWLLDFLNLIPPSIFVWNDETKFKQRKFQIRTKVGLHWVDTNYQNISSAKGASEYFRYPVISDIFPGQAQEYFSLDFHKNSRSVITLYQNFRSRSNKRHKPPIPAENNAPTISLLGWFQINPILIYILNYFCF